MQYFLTSKEGVIGKLPEKEEAAEPIEEGKPKRKLFGRSREEKKAGAEKSGEGPIQDAGADINGYEAKQEDEAKQGEEKAE